MLNNALALRDFWLPSRCSWGLRTSRICNGLWQLGTEVSWQHIGSL